MHELRFLNSREMTVTWYLKIDDLIFGNLQWSRQPCNCSDPSEQTVTEGRRDVRSVKDIWKQFCQIRSGISFSTTRLYHLCVFARVFHLFVMRLRSGGFRSHICLSWVCYYLWENPSHCLIQPSNHLLTVISCALLNCEQNYLAYSARCFSYGLTRRHSSNPATTQSVRREARDMNEGATWEKNMVGCMLPFVVHRGCCEYDRPLQTLLVQRQAPVSFNTAVNDSNALKLPLFPSVVRLAKT